MLDEYKDACARLTLGQEKLEEMITMTESKTKKRLSRPIKIAIVVAACMAALSLTAFAASPAGQEAIQKMFFVTYTVTSYEDGNYVVTTKDGAELHLTPTVHPITGTYTYTGTVETDDEGSTVQVEVESDEEIEVGIVQVELQENSDATVEADTPNSAVYDVGVVRVDGQDLDLTPTEDAAPDATYVYTGTIEADGEGSIVQVHLDQSPEAMTAGDAPEDGIVIRYVTAQ